MCSQGTMCGPPAPATGPPTWCRLSIWATAIARGSSGAMSTTRTTRVRGGARPLAVVARTLDLGPLLARRSLGAGGGLLVLGFRRNFFHTPSPKGYWAQVGRTSDTTVRQAHRK